MMDKAKLILSLREQLEAQLKALEGAAREAHSRATHKELKAENKHDTQAIEAGYLAEAQAKRAHDFKEDLEKIRTLMAKKSHTVEIGALVKIAGDQKGWFFFVPCRGGSKIRLQDQDITPLSKTSPLAQALMGLEEGDSASYTSPKGKLEVTIEEIR